MSTKVLIFDSEKFNVEKMLQKAKYITGSPLTELHHAQDMESFGRMLITQAPWVMIIVNFQMPDFWDAMGPALENFVVNVKKCQQKPFIFVGVTSWETQISTLGRLGLSITHKDYNGLQEDVMEKEKKAITKEEITKAVCRYYDMPYERAFAKSRKREVTKVRQISMYLCKLFTTESLKVIGEFFGGRDHTTVIHSCNRVKDYMDTEETYLGEVLILQETIEQMRV